MSAPAEPLRLLLLADTPDWAPLLGERLRALGPAFSLSIVTTWEGAATLFAAEPRGCSWPRRPACRWGLLSLAGDPAVAAGAGAGAGWGGRLAGRRTAFRGQPAPLPALRARAPGFAGDPATARRAGSADRHRQPPGLPDPARGAPQRIRRAWPGARPPRPGQLPSRQRFPRPPGRRPSDPAGGQPPARLHGERRQPGAPGQRRVRPAAGHPSRSATRRAGRRTHRRMPRRALLDRWRACCWVAAWDSPTPVPTKAPTR